MGSPVRPSQFKAVLSSGSDKACDTLNKAVLRFPALFYQWFNWAFKEDGTFSDEFRLSLGNTDGGLATVKPEVPITLTASNDKKGYIFLTWAMPANSSKADQYKVYRSEDDDSSTATLISTVSNGAMSYMDSYNSVSNPIVAGGTGYHYWVIAGNTAGESDYSTSANGIMQAPTSSSGIIRPSDGQSDLPFSAGSIDIYVWGGGGGGGTGTGPAAFSSDFSTPRKGGGGGGAGGAVKITLVLTGTTTISFLAGKGGQPKSPGSMSWAKISGESATLAAGTGGGAGYDGSTNGTGGACGTGSYSSSVSGLSGTIYASNNGNSGTSTSGGAGGVGSSISIDAIANVFGGGGRGGAASQEAPGSGGVDGAIYYKYTAA